MLDIFFLRAMRSKEAEDGRFTVYRGRKDNNYVQMMSVKLLYIM